MLRDNEKFFAFLALGAAVLVIVMLAVFFPPADEKVSRIMDSACGGFLLALGGAAQALFRSRSDAATAEVTQSVVDKLPPPTGEAAQAAGPQVDEGAPAWTR
jgi:hypothetical protein